MYQKEEKRGRNFHGISVLIVEDDNNIAEPCRCIWKKEEGYAVTIARMGARECLNSDIKPIPGHQAGFGAAGPDAPVMDGWAVCKTIRAESQVPHHHAHRQRGETSDKGKRPEGRRR